ncbi:hypothetical protein NDU88_000789 [Pleurodeles waltl]|uniref:Uncharacterized protein n=1 Tax=Pleurodeles waltl TaxID=8319 RepID=A0AAV7L9F1_PLEWA|nr:hypothetical protein NDU88_000789 [Pleurodeles waltl]
METLAVASLLLGDTFISWKTRQRAPLPGDARGSDVYLPEGASACSVAKETLAAILEQRTPATVYMRHEQKLLTSPARAVQCAFYRRVRLSRASWKSQSVSTGTETQHMPRSSTRIGVSRALICVLEMRFQGNGH